MTRIVERSTDYGRTWAATSYHPRSPLAAILAGLDPYEIHDDGLGNLYRWRPVDMCPFCMLFDSETDGLDDWFFYYLTPSNIPPDEVERYAPWVVSPHLFAEVSS